MMAYCKESGAAMGDEPAPKAEKKQSERAIDVTSMADDVTGDLDGTVRRFEEWAKDNDPMLAELLGAKPMPKDED
jgi:hypothetical protein